MRFTSGAVAFVLVSLLSGQQQRKQRFADCDKTAQTQADLTERGNNEYKGADDELDRTYRQLVRKTAGDPVATQKIRGAQRAWVAFRDAQIAVCILPRTKRSTARYFRCVPTSLWRT
jgi:uncharacterized protein YecT (DUF1311 family)